MSWLDDLARGAQDLGKGLVKAPVQFVNQGIGSAVQAKYTADGLLAQLTNNKQGLNRALANQKRARQDWFDHGLFDMGGQTSAADFRRGDALTGVKKIGGGTLETAATVLPFAKGGSLALGLGKGALRTTIPKIAAQGALYGGMFSAGNQLREKGSVDASQLARDAALGGALNVGVPLAARGVKNGVQTAARDLKATNFQLNPQAGFAKLPGTPAKEATSKIAAPVQQVIEKPMATKTAKNSLTEGAKQGRQNISQETIDLLDNGGHNVRNTQQLADRGDAAVESYKNLGSLSNAATKRLQVKPGSIGDEDISFVAKAIEKLDAAGKHDAASALHDSLSEHATAGGQQVQALSLLYNRSPQGLFNKAIRDINKANEKGYKMAPEVRANLKSLTDNIKNATNQDEKELAIGLLQKEVQKHLPTNAAQNAISVWKAGLLSGPITHAGNAASNATFGTLKKISDAPATLTDMGLARFGKTDLGQKLGFAGERTKGFTVRGVVSGTGEGAEKGLQTLKTGVDARNIVNGKYEGHGELNFKNPVIQKVFGDTSNGVFRLLSSGDQPFYYAAAKNSLYDQSIAAARNQGLKGNDLRNFVKNSVENPSTKMANQAQLDAQKAVLGEDRAISNNVSQFVGKHTALQAIVPFTRVPTNFLAQSLDYTPVGAIANVVKQVKNVKGGKGVDQRSLSEAIGKATTGTGLIFLGAELANSNMLSGQYPSGDPKESERWKAEGIQPNSI